jgi:hypothetical protein
MAKNDKGSKVALTLIYFVTMVEYIDSIWASLALTHNGTCKHLIEIGTTLTKHKA